MERYIYEMAVYCGAMKVWRVLNLNTGTIYSVDHETRELAEASIEDGKPRAGLTVKRVTLEQVIEGLAGLGESDTVKPKREVKRYNWMTPHG